MLAVLGIIVISTIAVVDHRHKKDVMARASVAEWMCAHEGRQCDEETTTHIEQRWAWRERAYKGADAALFLVGAVAVILALRRRR